MNKKLEEMHERMERLCYHPDEVLSRKILAMTNLVAEKANTPRVSFTTGWRLFGEMSTFLEEIERNVWSKDCDVIADFCVWSLFMRRNLPTKYVKAETVFTKTSVARYFSDDEEESKVSARKWLKRNGVSMNNLVELVSEELGGHPLAPFVYIKADDMTKDRLLNFDAGFVICTTATSMWSPLSDPCGECDFMEDCKTELKHKFPELYKLRCRYLKLDKAEETEDGEES